MEGRTEGSLMGHHRMCVPGMTRFKDNQKTQQMKDLLDEVESSL